GGRGVAAGLRRRRHAGAAIKPWDLGSGPPTIPAASQAQNPAARENSRVEQGPMRPAASDVARVRSDHAIADVLIVDDHPLMCDALSATLGYAFGLRRMRIAASLAAALESIREEGVPDAVVLDLNLPDSEGVGGILAIRRADARLP